MSLEAYAIVDSTLREGEQFERSDFSTSDKVAIARSLAAFGVEYIEVTSPMASARSRSDCEKIVALGLPSKIVPHIRCDERDAEVALGTGVRVLNMVSPLSPTLRASSHGLDVDGVVRRAIAVATMIRAMAPETELRFSSEDSFRCP